MPPKSPKTPKAPRIGKGKPFRNTPRPLVSVAEAKRQAAEEARKHRAELPGESKVKPPAAMTWGCVCKALRIDPVSPEGIRDYDVPEEDDALEIRLVWAPRRSQDILLSKPKPHPLEARGEALALHSAEHRRFQQGVWQLHHASLDVPSSPEGIISEDRWLLDHDSALRLLIHHALAQFAPFMALGVDVEVEIGEPKRHGPIGTYKVAIYQEGPEQVNVHAVYQGRFSTRQVKPHQLAEAVADACSSIWSDGTGAADARDRVQRAQSKSHGQPKKRGR